jgi:hypothetical protein
MLPIFAVGAAAAVSLLPYVPLIAGAHWHVIYKVGFLFSIGWSQLSEATGSPLSGFTWVWIALWIGAIAALFFVLFGGRDRLPNQVRDLILFAGTSLVLGVAAYAVFLKLAQLPTHYWHYVPLMAFSAACLDAMFFVVWRWARPVAVILAALTISMTFLFALSAVKCRQTNVDLVAATLSKQVAPNDYVIVHPFYCGVTFNRYYKGAVDNPSAVGRLYITALGPVYGEDANKRPHRAGNRADYFHASIGESCLACWELPLRQKAARGNSPRAE